MNVGILGSGDVARALGVGFLAEGHSVMLGSRSPERLEGWAGEAGEGLAGTVEQTAIHGELLVLAVKGTAALEVLDQAGAGNLAGKTIIDATNPIAEAPPVNGVLRFFTDLDESLMEKLQKAFPDARLVKAFNSVGSKHMVAPHFEGGRPTMFICGNNLEARGTVRDVLDRFGWDTADMGSAEAARAIEPLCMLWCIPGFLRNEWDHAFKLMS